MRASEPAGEIPSAARDLRGNTHHGGTETQRKLAAVPKTPHPKHCHPERPRVPARFHQRGKRSRRISVFSPNQCPALSVSETPTRQPPGAGVPRTPGFGVRGRETAAPQPPSSQTQQKRFVRCLLGRHAPPGSPLLESSTYGISRLGDHETKGVIWIILSHKESQLL